MALSDDKDRLSAVFAEIDRINSEDPRLETADGVHVPKEALYAQRMTERLDQMYPDASEALRIAAHAQHIQRWSIPRDTFPSGRAGYHAWRSACQSHHASLISQIMSAAGYAQDMIDRVVMLIRKQNLKSNADSQRLENVAGVVFIEHEFEPFSKKHDEDKLITILKKTARKMDGEGLRAVGSLTLPRSLKDLLEKALA